MKRISITDLNGGVVNAVDPTLMPDNACVEIDNYEYRDFTGLAKRMGVFPHELAATGLTGAMAIGVWYPNHYPAGCTGDKVYVVQTQRDIRLCWYAGTGWQARTVFILESVAPVCIYTGYSRVLIADAVNPGRYISINKDGEIEYGEIGIIAPTIMPQVSAAGVDNTYADVGQENTGMTVERGDILQYCYTVEDKYGAESSPSPLVTEQRLMYKYPDPESPLGYKYYWYGTRVMGLSVAQYPPGIRDRLKYINLYRRSIPFQEGTIANQFLLVKQIPLGLVDVIDVVDTNKDDLRTIAYDRGVAPASEHITEGNGVVYLGAVTRPTIRFPFTFDRYVEIAVRNDNNLDYANAIIAMRWNAVEMGLASWRGYLANKTTVRLFYTDTITPIPVIYQQVNETLYVYVKVPALHRGTMTKLYLTFADVDGHGVLDNDWNAYRYGLFFDIDNDIWSAQVIFDINRVRSVDTLISSNIPYANPGTAYVMNLANMDRGKGVIHGGDTLLASGATDFVISAFRRRMELTERAIFLAPGTRIGYTLLTAPPRAVFAVSGEISLSAVSETRIFWWGNIGIMIKRLETLLELSMEEAELVLIPPAYSQHHYFAAGSDAGVLRFRLALVFDGGTIDGIFSYADALDHYDYVSIRWTHPINIPLNRGVVVGRTMFGTVTHTLSKVIFAEAPALSSDERIKYAFCVLNEVPFYRTPIGSDTSLPLNEWANTNIAMELKEIETETNRNHVHWSDTTGQYFNALDFKKFREPVSALLTAPSFLRMQYQNTLIIFTRNTISRLVLTDDLSRMAQAMDNVIEEYKSGGLFARDSIVTAANAMYWFSERGVMRWSPDGLAHLSWGIINIPIHQNYIGVYIAENGQYLLYDKSSGVSYVYHELNKAWTTFSGLHFVGYAYLNQGDSADNKVLMLEDTGAFVQYPGDAVDETVTHTIKTKQFFIDNAKPIRYRCMWDRDTAPDVIIAETYNHRLSKEPIRTRAQSPRRYEWLYLPNGFWGEYIQFEFSGIDRLTKLDIDLKEGV